VATSVLVVLILAGSATRALAHLTESLRIHKSAFW
jgi:hypothetical protein